MQKRQRKASVEGKRTLPLGAAVKSFMGHLEGTGKAKHTLDSYHFDLLSFGEFLQVGRGKPTLDLRLLSRKDLERYHHWLKASGQKTNTRRRKLMTVRKFMHYLTARGKLDLDIAKKIPAPEKIERVPGTIPLEELRLQMRGLPQSTHLHLRNLSLLGLLTDTGCGVSEAAKIRWSMVDLKKGKVAFLGKSEREGELLPSTCHSLTELRSIIAKEMKITESDLADELCFVGFNRHGPMRVGKKSFSITPRGIELLVKTLVESLGFPNVTPRTLRHSAVIEWFKTGILEDEIQKRLGLKTAYAFRIYEPIFATIRSKSIATSSA